MLSIKVLPTIVETISLSILLLNLFFIFIITKRIITNSIGDGNVVATKSPLWSVGIISSDRINDGRLLSVIWCWISWINTDGTIPTAAVGFIILLAQRTNQEGGWIGLLVLFKLSLIWWLFFYPIKNPS